MPTHGEALPAKRMAPLVLVGTLATHLFGGSAGREGTAIQMSGSLNDLLARTLKVPKRAITIVGGEKSRTKRVRKRGGRPPERPSPRAEPLRTRA